MVAFIAWNAGRRFRTWRIWMVLRRESEWRSCRWRRWPRSLWSTNKEGSQWERIWIRRWRWVDGIEGLCRAMRSSMQRLMRLWRGFASWSARGSFGRSRRDRKSKIGLRCWWTAARRLRGRRWKRQIALCMIRSRRRKIWNWFRIRLRITRSIVRDVCCLFDRKYWKVRWRNGD